MTNDELTLQRKLMREEKKQLHKKAIEVVNTTKLSLNGRVYNESEISMLLGVNRHKIQGILDNVRLVFSKVGLKDTLMYNQNMKIRNMFINDEL